MTAPRLKPVLGYAYISGLLRADHHTAWSRPPDADEHMVPVLTIPLTEDVVRELLSTAAQARVPLHHAYGEGPPSVPVGSAMADAALGAIGITVRAKVDYRRLSKLGCEISRTERAVALLEGKP